MQIFEKLGKKEIKKKIHTGAGLLFLAGSFIFLQRLSKAVKEPEDIDQENTYLEKDAYDGPETSSFSSDITLYERFGKRALDKALSFAGLVLFAPIFAAIALAIEIDDPGPVLFKQKRVGKDKHLFEMHKFRSMKMSAPKDVPAEEFEEQEKYITRVGRFLRKTSLDELPQLWDVFRGKMSLVGPRPVIWTTKDLISERDKYSANSVMPGITGMAQINGRDRLDSIKKAEWDGKYVNALREGLLSGLMTDFNCLTSTPAALIDEYMKTENRSEDE